MPMVPLDKFLNSHDSDVTAGRPCAQRSLSPDIPKDSEGAFKSGTPCSIAGE